MKNRKRTLTDSSFKHCLCRTKCLQHPHKFLVEVYMHINLKVLMALMRSSVFSKHNRYTGHIEIKSEGGNCTSSVYKTTPYHFGCEVYMKWSQPV